MNSAYYQHICSGTAHAIARQSRAKEVLQQPELLVDLTAFASNLANPNLHKALWIIELVAVKKPIWIVPHLPQLLEVAPNYTHESAKRAFSNTLAKLCLAKLIPENLAEASVELALQWLIQPEKTVPKVMAIRILYHYHIQFPWVVEPLLELMQKILHNNHPVCNIRCANSANTWRKSAIKLYFSHFGCMKTKWHHFYPTPTI